MYIEAVPNRNSPPAILLRESYRGRDGKVKKRTLANLSSWDPELVEGLRALLKGGRAGALPPGGQFSVRRSLPHGHVAAVLGVLRSCGLQRALGRKGTRERSLATALVAARILHPGSKLGLSRHLGPATATSTLGEELGLGPAGEQELYAAMRWLLDRQPKIERRLASAHLGEGGAVLYDLTSTYYEGSSCPLAEYGHSRDGKKGKRQINFGLLCSAGGCPVSVEVFGGSAADPSTVGGAVEKLRERFGIGRILLVGDRGMLTSARIGELRKDGRLAWISALRAESVRKLAARADFQGELFDERGLAEITSPEHFPGERLVVCRNPALAAERSRKREELLGLTAAKLEKIARACRRSRAPYRGKDRIARRVEREAAKYKMLKHFKLEITEESLTYRRDEEAVGAEAALDGIYVVRSGRVGHSEMGAEKLVETYKALSGVERAFRGHKATGAQVRPIFHREEDMVRSHIFICMLAYHVRWHMERLLAPALFNDEVPGGGPRPGPVAKAVRSGAAKRKAAGKEAPDGLPVHSLQTLLDDLATLCRVTLRPNLPGAEPIYKLSEPTPVQEKILGLLGVKPQPLPAM